MRSSVIPPPIRRSIPCHHRNGHPQAQWANPTAPVGLRSTLINDSSKINKLAPASASTSTMTAKGRREASGAPLLLKPLASQGSTAANLGLETTKSPFSSHFQPQQSRHGCWRTRGWGWGGNWFLMPPCLQMVPGCSSLGFLGTTETIQASSAEPAVR